ncbi:phosphatase PAP2 family protein [Saccharospirillum impatiens]|uniref:phosphatase PAP2 family protein n=1 Tax=Saccharospirillum impatiens TaxID=169438 RepID=UPI0004261E70|nr:phosphatase PAP2 family protein [Saccharospirillum impatiens]
MKSRLNRRHFNWLSSVSVIALTLISNLGHADDRWIQAGEVLLYALPLTAATATYTLDDPEGRSQLVMAYGITLSSSYVLKGLVERERPDGTDDLSFPSFSAASAFTSAAFIQRRYGWDAGLPAYLAASYVGWSKVYSDRHHPTDVFAGAALAWGVNQWLVEPGSASQFALLPTDGGMALAFQLSF